MESSPLSVVKLFTSGRYMRSLSLITLLTQSSETWPGMPTGAAPMMEMQQTQSFGWGAFERGRFTSASNLFACPGNFIVDRITAALGMRGAMQLGFLSWGLQSLAFGLARRPGLYMAATTPPPRPRP